MKTELRKTLLALAAGMLPVLAVPATVAAPVAENPVFDQVKSDNVDLSGRSKPIVAETLDDTIKAVQRFLRFDPYNADLYQQLGDLWFLKKQNPHKAVGEWQRSVVLDPGNGPKHFFLAWTYLTRIYDLDRAEMYALQAIKLGREQEKTVSFWYQMAYWVLYRVYEERGFPQTAAYYKNEWYKFWTYPEFKEPPVTVVREKIRRLKKELALE